MENTNYEYHLAAPEEPDYVPPSPPKRRDAVKKRHPLVRLIRWLFFPHKPEYLGEWVFSMRDHIWRFHVSVYGPEE